MPPVGSPFTYATASDSRQADPQAVTSPLVLPELSQDIEAEPLFRPAPPQSAQPQQSRGIPPLLMALLPIAMAKGGREGVAGLLSGYMRSQQQNRQFALEEEDRTLRRRTIDAQDARIQQDAAYRQQQRRQSAIGWLNDVRGHLSKTTTPLEYEQALASAKAMAPTYGVDATKLDTFVSKPEARWRDQQISTLRHRLDAMLKNETPLEIGGRTVTIRDAWGTPEVDGLSMQLPSGETITVGEARRLAGDVLLDPSGQPVRGAGRQGRVTYADVFPAAKGTRMADHALPNEHGVVNWDAATRIANRMGWVTSDSDRRGARERAVEEARDRLRFVMRNPAAAKGNVRGALARLASLGLDVEVEKDRAARAIEADILARERRVRLADPDPTDGVQADIATTDDLIVDFERALQAEGGPGGLGTHQPTPSAPPATPPTLRPGVTYRFVPGKGLVPKQ